MFFKAIFLIFLLSLSLYSACDNSLKGSEELDCGTGWSISVGDFDAPCCEDDEILFDIFDAFRDGDSDKNISTKVINIGFDINITSKDDFNGTICVRIKSDNNESDWIKEDFNNTKIITFNDLNVSFISKEANIFLKYKKNDDGNCDDTLDGNSTSQDSFSIRPKEFFITLSTDTIKAGDDFNITFLAGYDEDDVSFDYNESNEGDDASFDVDISEKISGCIVGEFNPDITNDVNFTDGIKRFENVIYNEVGDIELSISEKSTCSDRYASIDCDDADISGVWTKDDNLSIVSKIKEIRIYPYLFFVDISSKNFNNGSFTYLSKDLNMSAMVDINITSQSKDKNTTKNYNTDCYANDISLDFNYTQVDENLKSFIYFYSQDSNSSQEIQDINDRVGDTLDKDYFSTDTNGSALFTIYYNFDRNKSKPINPFDINITSFNVTDDDVNGSGVDDDYATFVFARLKAKDISTTLKDINMSVEIEVYDDAHTKYTDSLKQNSLKWYKNEYHDNATYGYIYQVSDTKNTTLEGDGDIDVVIDSLLKGEIILSISKDDESNSNNYIIHLDTNRYLWYVFDGFGDEYDYSDGSSCLAHPCFTYKYKVSNFQDISSGDFKGGDINLKDRGQNTKVGVKVFR